MKIVYLGKFDNPFSDSTEKHIQYAFEQLGHQVVPINEKDFSVDEILKEKGDLFLFHKTLQIPGDSLIELLNKLTCKKVYWYFDPVELTPEREIWLGGITPYVDYAFLTDGTWIRRRNYKNTHQLMQGIGNEDTSLGKYRKEYDCKIAFLGSAYGARQAWIRDIREIYGDDFKVFNNIFNRDLNDFCASCKIIVAPDFPSTDFYWSSRIYMTLGSGGFLIHPTLGGLKEEFTAGKHYAGYKDFEGMIKQIDYYLKHKKERKKIQMAGYKKCIENFTYKDRVKKLLEYVG